MTTRAPDPQTRATARAARVPAAGRLLPALALLATTAWGATQVVAALVRPPAAAEPVPASWADFWEGRTTRTLERNIDRGLPARDALVAAANGARWLVQRGAADGVRVGRDGWLFLTDELEFHPHGPEHLRARVALLDGASRALAARGERLVVALVPDKARVYAARLAGGALPPFARDRYRLALDSLRERGVAAVDLLAPLERAARARDVYYRTDTHWNQAGARVAADAVAAAVRALEPDLPASSFRTAAAGPEAARPGDLLRLMGLEHAPDWSRPRPDREAPVSTAQAGDGGGGLFGDAEIPVALVGTSYSLRGNFHGYLQEALGASVLNAAKDGAGFLKVMTEYLGDDAYRDAPPRVIVWEVPERFLQAPLDGEPGWAGRVGLAR